MVKRRRPKDVMALRDVQRDSVILALETHGTVRKAAEACGICYRDVYRWMSEDIEFRGAVERVLQARKEGYAGALVDRMQAAVMEALESGDPERIRATSSHVRVLAESLGLTGQNRLTPNVVINNQMLSVPGLADLVKSADRWEQEKGRVR